MTATPVKAATSRNPRLAALLKTAAAPDLTTTTAPTPAPSKTPTLLRRAQVVIVVVLLVLGAVAAGQLFQAQTQLAATPQLLEQYDRLAVIEADLIEARNLASLRNLAVTSADPSAALDRAAAFLVAATAQRPGDQVALAEVARATVTYAALLRTPTTAQLATADQLLSGTIQPKLQQLRANLQVEADSHSTGLEVTLLWLTVIAAGVALIVVSVRLARHTHRAVNAGVGVAVIAAIITAWLGLAGLAGAEATDQAGRTTNFDRVVGLAQGRLGLAELRRQLTGAVTAGGVSADAQTAIAAQLKQLSVNKMLPAYSVNVTTTYNDLYATLNKGERTKVINGLTQAAATDRLFLSKVADDTTSTVTQGTRNIRFTLNSLQGEAVAALLVALAGAAAGYWGVSRRLREYR